MKHKGVVVDDLMYPGCERHTGCVICSECEPLHCYSFDQFNEFECPGLRDLTFEIPRGKKKYAEDMRKIASILEKWRISTF